MSARTPSPAWLAIVALLFLGMHGIPAVSSYLELRWPDVALGGIVFIALFLLGGFVRSRDGRRDRVLVVHWLLLLAYLVHQFEEHGVDLYGRVYAFLPYVNAALAPRGLELTPGSILRINTLAIWLPFLIAVWGGQRFTWPGLTCAGLVLTNGLFHIGIALARGEYNPGVASAIVIFLPLAAFYFSRIGASPSAIAGGIAFGVAAHAALPLFIGSGAPAIAVALLAVAPLAANVAWLRGARGRT